MYTMRWVRIATAERASRQSRHLEAAQCMTESEARKHGCATHVPCTSLEPVSLAWRALEARAARIAKVLSSIFDMHDSLRYCTAGRRCQQRYGSGARQVLAARTMVTRSGFSSSFAGLDERAPSVHCVRSAVAAGGEPAVVRVSMWPTPTCCAATTHLSPPGRTDKHQRSGRAVLTAAIR